MRKESCCAVVHASFRPRWWLVGAVVAAATVTGCSDSGPRGLQSAPAFVTTGQGTCDVLANEELELVLNASLRGRDEGRGTRFAPEVAAEAAEETQQRVFDPAGGAQEPRPPSGDLDVPEVGDRETGAAQEDAAHANREGSADARRGHRAKPELLPGMEMCRATGEDAGELLWGVLTENAVEQFDRYREWHGKGVESLRVGSHEALWDEELRRLLVLDDDIAVGVQLTVPNPPTNQPGEADSEEQQHEADDDTEASRSEEAAAHVEHQLDAGGAEYLREQAGELALRALRRH